MKMFTLVRAVIAIVCPIFSLGAQASHDDGIGPHTASPGADALGFWMGVAHASVPGVFAHAQGSDLALTAVRWTHTLVQSHSFSMNYVLDVLPIAIVSMPLPTDSYSGGGGCQAGKPCVLRAVFAEQRTVFGAGAMPLGLQFRLAPRRRIQPFAAASGGFLWFADRIPDREAARLNFAADVGAGAVVVLSSRVDLLLGYQFHHLSNGGTAPSNPGIDSHLFYLGVARLLHRD